MSELGNANWSETAASNNTTPPDGWPEGMNPSDVNNAAREMMSALKKEWNRQNVVKTTAGTSTAYTLTYDVAEAQYYSGQRFGFIVNATCGAAPTLNINGLGAQNLRKFSAGAFTTLSAGDIVANQPLEVYYNSSATTFDILTQQPTPVWQVLGVNTPSGATVSDFTGISTSINNLHCLFSLKPSVSQQIGIQVYGTGGTLDSTTAYYTTINTASGGAVANIQSSTAGALCATSIDSANQVFTGDFTASAIQASNYTNFNFRTGYLSSSATRTDTGIITHSVAANITGVRFYIIAGGGTFTGRITLFGSTN